MEDLPQIDVAEALRLLASGEAKFVDVRDAASYHGAHVPGAIHLDDSTVQGFVQESDKCARLVVYCYHGRSSLGATAFFIDQGFAEVSSMSGGFTAWQEAGGASESGSDNG